jgi:Ca2+-binding RTX toxin-like protein
VVSNVETVNFVGGGHWTVGLDSHFHGTVDGFSNLDLIDLTGIGLATSAHLGQGNVLTLAGGAGGPVTLQFDAQQSFAGYVFQLSSDGMGGTDLALAKVITGGNGGQALAGTPGNDVITGGNGADTLNGGDGNDSLSGGNGADALMAGTGNDTLTGGNGPDTFAFGAVFGKDLVTDFHQGDQIKFDGAFANFAAVQDAMQQVGADTVIRMDADHMITLTGVSMASLHASDFLFH